MRRHGPGADDGSEDGGLSAPWGTWVRSRGRRALARHALVAALAVAASHPAAAGDGPVPWSEHRALALPIPMTVVGTRSIPAGTAQEYFRALAALGFGCTAEDSPRRRVRRVRVACSHGPTTLLYEGGFPVGYGSVVFDRVRRDGDLLGGAALVAHVRSVAPGPGAGPDGGARAVAEPDGRARAVAEAREANGVPDR
jgi:hypothetical protein